MARLQTRGRAHVHVAQHTNVIDVDLAHLNASIGECLLQADAGIHLHELFTNTAGQRDRMSVLIADRRTHDFVVLLGAGEDRRDRAASYKGHVGRQHQHGGGVRGGEPGLNRGKHAARPLVVDDDGHARVDQ